MTNFEAWQTYMRDFRSPQSFVDAGFFYLISAALQRRVWVGPEHSPLYPNLYIILTGDAGVGKGLVIKQVENFLKYHKRKDPNNASNGSGKPIDVSTEDKAAKLVAEAESFQKAKEQQVKNSIEMPLKIPMAPSATTFEALVQAIAGAVRTKEFKRWCDKQNKEIWDYYRHHSLAFCLEELSSIMRKKQEETARFLLVTYDCGDYEYRTKNHGTDIIRSCCVNFFAGTTPVFMRELLGMKMADDGFISRTLFVYEPLPRHDEPFIKPLDEEQKAARVQVLNHLEKLIDLYGPTQYTPAATEFYANWFRTELKNEKATCSYTLKSYFERKGALVQKLAMAIHYGESTLPIIDVEPFKKAIEWLKYVQKKMHHAIAIDERNPLARVAAKITTRLGAAGPKTFVDLLLEFEKDGNSAEIKQVVSDLEETARVHRITMQDKEKKTRVITFYTEKTITQEQLKEKYPESKYEAIND